MENINKNYYDVVICGGGLAGLTLARQLALKLPDLTVLVLDKQTRPLPLAAFKVGESTNEGGSHYFSEVLQLGDYLHEHQLSKLGLRFFYRGEGSDFSHRPEWGIGDFPPAQSFQLDRGAFENHLRDVVNESPVDLLEGCSTKEISLGNGSHPHQVTYRVGRRRSVSTVQCRWVIDATGRSRMLQRQLKLGKKGQTKCSSAWFRLAGVLDLDDFVPRNKRKWHARATQSRWYSTNHLMGPGYWVWVIPLAPDCTSVGIVTREDLQPFSEYQTFDKAMAWLEKNEPELARRVGQFDLMDFRVMRHYSYSSRQVFSEDRWSCVGEAAVFPDPYYAVGSNMIAYANTITTKLIEQEVAGKLTSEYVKHVNGFFLSLNESLTHNIQYAYSFYGNAPVMALKTLWDFCVGWSIADPQLYRETYLDEKVSNVLSDLVSGVIVTQSRMQQMFSHWAERSSCSFRFDYIDYLDQLPVISDLLVRNLPGKKKGLPEVLRDFRLNADRLEEIAQTIFFMAVEDTLPDKLSLFSDRPWINTQAISLDPECWETDGLFQPKSQPRDYSAVEDEIRNLFTFKKALAAAR